MSAVSNGVLSATYAYHANSSLISNLIYKTSSTTVLTTTKAYDSLNRLTHIDNVILSGAKNLSHTYNYNDANQRTKRTDTDSSYWDYGYDSLGQVTSGKRYWSDLTQVAGQQFEYDFDDIGNRKSATVNSHVSTYGENSVNQYTNRTVVGAIDIIGSAHTDATVTVNNDATTRKADYFHSELSITNTVAAQYPQISIVGVRKNAGTNNLDVVTEQFGNRYLPKTPEAYTYDDDGNLESDGRWTYTWNGENRLIEMETSSTATSVVGNARAKLLFGYDYQGRRTSKVVSNWTGSA